MVFEGFSLEIKNGERVLIVGPNGSGKTTLANIISGHLAPQKGQVQLPLNISSITLPVVLPPLDVKELIRDRGLLEDFGLCEVVDCLADELSEGQKQKLALALALTKDADLFVFDEPLANVDVGSREAIMRAILKRTKGKTLVVIMHGFEDFYQLFDRRIHLEKVAERSLL